MIEYEHLLALYIRSQPFVIVHDNRCSMCFCYDSDLHHFMYRYDDEDDHSWKICPELDDALRKLVHERLHLS